MVSANTVAQNPAGSVIPPLSPAHAVVFDAWVLLAAALVSEVLPLSVLAHADSAKAANTRSEYREPRMLDLLDIVDLCE
jgi:hypothetical protein